MTLAYLQDRVYWVKEGQLLAGAYPGGHQEAIAREKLAWLLDRGVNCFIDLTQENELTPYAPFLPEGVAYHRMAIRDMRVPTTTQMIAILNQIDTAIAEGKTVYTHCWAGRGRTGTVVGCWLARHGVIGQATIEAIARLRGGKRDSPETGEQSDFVRRWDTGK